jgi:hypothetical protein
VQIVFDELLPVLFATPAAHGGFAWASKDIGTMQLCQGLAQVGFNLLIYRHVNARLGLIRGFRYAMLPWVLFLAFPALARLSPWPSLQWAVTAAALTAKIFLTTTAFTSIICIINNSTRGRALGSVNGVAQAGASFVRFVGPTLGGGLYSLSLTYHEALGDLHLHVAYLVVALTAALTFGASFWLPAWTETTEDDAVEAEAKARLAAAAASAAAGVAPRRAGKEGEGETDDEDEELERELAEAAAPAVAPAPAPARAPARARLAAPATDTEAAAADNAAFEEFGGGGKRARAPR